jgi:hypothetical protein
MTSPLAGSAAEGSEPQDEDPTAGAHTFRDGSSMVIDREAFSGFARGLLHSPAVVAVLSDKVNAMADYANQLAVQKGAEYAVTIVDNWPDSKRARANVWSSNFAAMLDDAKNATLLKTLAHFGGTASQ